MALLNLAMETLEQWRPAAGYEGIYEVSNLGTVRRILRRRGVKGNGIIVPVVAGKGYLTVKLRNCGADTRAYVHRLVAMAFVPNPDGKPQVNHMDGTRTNNLPANLEWVTCRENLLHAFRVLKRWNGNRNGSPGHLGFPRSATLALGRRRLTGAT